MFRSDSLKSRARRKNGFHYLKVFYVSIGLAACLYSAWAVYCPSRAGRLGAWAQQGLIFLLGQAAYLVPIIFLSILFNLITEKRPVFRYLDHLLSFLGLISLAALFSLSESLFHLVSPLRAGGWLGSQAAAILSSWLGRFGAFLASAAVLMAALHLLYGIPWRRMASALFEKLLRDCRSWQKSREALVKAVAAAPEPELSLVEPVKIAAVPEEPVPVREEPILAEAARIVNAPERARLSAEGKGSYRLPSLDLLNPSASKDKGKPSPGEIQASAALLEATLKNFGVVASVSGASPGPVITRYELSPAPGVKVSSIAALENDIALALKAKGIRILAPIPGKGAVGVEIPNARPATVGLREILESPALANSRRPLLFGLGLSADGDPQSADLQAMPHLLIAGATNSGKSVLIHALIASMLFRVRPDEVKFVLIDPKRLELTFYEGIPHLFDPTTAPDKVGVVTAPKEAAKTLKAVVRLMEKRYEKFQLCGARNIDAYNEQADAKEPFIVVIIDELADLILTAKDSVEDSIQRLTQMARAVGIHLVLATQRPSVDVITGVIKANLPCRIALQVASKVDSKVILDSTGADALQGRGDLLYLAAGSQKPERCQGAYVSEAEIMRLASYLKTQAKPDYPVLETMNKSVEADLGALGVEPLEFSQALKLVLERRRVSQDLLKSHFGSSARATNLLSALEVKELIHKPEGSNHWEVHFDQIEDYLRRHFPQVPVEIRD